MTFSRAVATCNHKWSFQVTKQTKFWALRNCKNRFKIAVSVSFSNQVNRKFKSTEALGNKVDDVEGLQTLLLVINNSFYFVPGEK